MWRCPKCFAVDSRPGRACAFCGAAVEAPGRRIIERQGRLVEIDTDRIARERERVAADERAREENHRRIRQLFGVFMRAGFTSTAAKPRVFQELAKWKASGQEWDEFMGHLRHTVSR
jgi:hypothetical protein